MTVLESIMAGTPVVAHAVGGIVNVLGQGSGGTLISDHSAQGYASALIALLQVPRPSEDLANAKEWITARFSAAQNAEKAITLYAELLRSPS